MTQQDSGRIPTRCACGRDHAPWWGRYVPAPSCKLLPADVALARLRQTTTGKERAHAN